jgi:hypothetical protein
MQLLKGDLSLPPGSIKNSNNAKLKNIYSN